MGVKTKNNNVVCMWLQEDEYIRRTIYTWHVEECLPDGEPIKMVGTWHRRDKKYAFLAARRYARANGLRLLIDERKE